LTHALLARIDRAFIARTRGHRDDLTGLLSRPALIEELEHQVAHARRAGESVSYLVLDLDHFRRINEQRGAVVGDLVLMQVARLVIAAVRAGDFVARMGGEEIGVLLRRCSSEHAVILAEKLRATVAGNPVTVDGASIPIRLSVGTATYPDQAASAQDLLRAGDRALAAAKAGGRDRVG
jgi:diguanylate cyclase (GGDEF)-like protein